MGDRHPEGTPAATVTGARIAPPDYQPPEDQYAAVWALVFTGPHRDCGGWFRDGWKRPVCSCGAYLSEPVRAAA